MFKSSGKFRPAKHLPLKTLISLLLFLLTMSMFFGCRGRGASTIDASTSSQDSGPTDDSTIADSSQTSCGDRVCSDTETSTNCPEDCDDCNNFPDEGCCDGNLLFWCDEDTLRTEDCDGTGCGWSLDEARYICGETGEDPSFANPRSCGCNEIKIDTRPRVYNGTHDPTAVCLTDGQILAIGALAEREGEGYTNFCTATLIADNVVLTAAHCVVDFWGNGNRNPDDVFFVVGLDVESPVHVFTVSDLYAHPSYDWEARHDIGLVVLQDSAKQTLPEIEPIPINTSPLEESFIGEIVQNVGYGATHDDENNTRRWWTEEPVTDLAPGDFEVYGNNWSSVCYGDSGGPSLYAFGGKRLSVVGTVSWGDPSCMEYDYFARVDDNTEFIVSHTNEWNICDEIDEIGVCNGLVAQWCEDNQLYQECCENGCSTNAAGKQRCIYEAPPCGDIDEKGTCEGDKLIWCKEGTLTQRFCNVCGNQTCGFINDTVGYGCIEE